MVVDLKDVVPFLVWLPGALLSWLIVVACVAAGATVAGWLISALRHGPRAATLIIGAGAARCPARLGPSLAATGVGLGSAGHSRVDPPPGGGRVRGLHLDPLVCRLVPRSRQPRPGPALPGLGADHHQLPGAVAGPVVEFAQFAGRHQESHPAHGGNQAGAGERSGVGADRGVRRGGNAVAGGHGRGQLRVRRAGT